ncbi:MAG TPA: hypothetical protein PLE09_01315 [Caldisericia bacterium]|jgi:hypothetical protein|nr:hypothetical protein [Caldisericia bacterium]HXK51179.1 hypothetical protein [Caldisericia bacterium]
MTQNNRWFFTILLIGCLLVSFSMTSCSFDPSTSRSTEKLMREYIGDEEILSEDMFQPLTIFEMTENAEEYAGTFVIVSGKIVSLCPVGCYFFMHDEDGNQVYVDLAPQNFDVPQSALGENVEVWGLGSVTGGAPKVSAYKVVFLDVEEEIVQD